MKKNLDYCKYLHPPPPSPKLLKDGLILAMLMLKLLLNNKLGKNLAKEEYPPPVRSVLSSQLFLPPVFQVFNPLPSSNPNI